MKKKIPINSWSVQTLKKTFYSLRNRNYRLFFIGQLISNTGNWLTNVALILLVFNITNSGFSVGLLAAFQYGPVLFFSAWAGSIADRMDKRRMLLVTQSLEMLQSVGLAILAFMPHPSIIGLYALALVGGILIAFDNPFRRSFLSEMVPAEDIPNAVVLNSLLINIPRIVGPALAGLLVITVGFGWCFSIDAASYLAVLAAIYMMRTSELYRKSHKDQSQEGVRAGLRYVRSLPILWISFAMLAATGMLVYNFTVTLPIFVSKALQSNNEVFTILYSVFSFGAVICGLFVAHRALVKMKHIIIGAAALGCTMLLLASATNVNTALIVAFMMGMASVLYTTSTTAIAQVESKPEMHGRVLALQSVLTAGTTLIGGPLSGWLADILGARAPIILGGVVCLLAAVFGFFAIRHYSVPNAVKQI
jgi:MFS family permease